MNAMFVMDAMVVICHTRVSHDVGIEAGDTQASDVALRK